MQSADPVSAQNEVRPPRLLRAFVVQALLLIPWVPFAALSGMAYDNGRLWPAILFVGPFQAYPLLIIFFISGAAILKSRNKDQAAAFTVWLAPIISLGSLALAFVVAPHI